MSDSNESPGILDYNRMVQDALRGVMRMALAQVERHGFGGDHHFYITFQTDAPEVSIPAWLQARYPKDITIVVQHQFWDLAVEEDHFRITLSFGGNAAKLIVPFAAVTAFADPSVPFGLQFGDEEADKTSGEAAEDTPSQDLPVPSKKQDTDRKDATSEESGKHRREESEDKRERETATDKGKVVELDVFRKK